MPTTPENFTIVPGADLCMPGPWALGQAGNPRVHSMNSTGMLPVEFSGALQGQRLKAMGRDALIPFKTEAVRHCQQVPSSSLYLWVWRGLGRSACNFVELPIASHFICIFEVGFTMKNGFKMQIKHSCVRLLAHKLLGAALRRRKCDLSVMASPQDALSFTRCETRCLTSANPSEQVADTTTIVPPQTLSELLHTLQHAQLKNFPALKSKASLLADLLHKSPDRVTIQDIEDIRPSLRLHLTKRRLTENSIRTYVNEIQFLLAQAKRVGWSTSIEIPPVWAEVWTAAPILFSRI